ncbi:MAG TPA: DNA polymerase III subunit gamma/tau [Ferruginibacter sp.]|nr:DNA polymerase III subunit gamma/tau [Ferruginibacter sp.]
MAIIKLLLPHFRMDKFIVSARKYRPQNFSTVIGQSHITTTLKNAIGNNQLAHAFLFCGPRGVGKTTCARILAKTINCQKRTKDGEACNTCVSCVSFDNGSSLNIHELDAASNNSVDDIRTLVEQVRFAPQAGDYKVYIVDEVHMLSAAAFNAFLKTLEEPPPYAIFILATTEKHKILPTILSRCQIFDFKRITINDTVTHLQDICQKEGIKAEKPALHIIAQKSEGALRDSLSILDKIVSFSGGEVTYNSVLEHLNILDEDYFFTLLGYMQQQQMAEALLLFDSINKKGFEGDSFLDGFAEFIRNLMVSKDSKAAALLNVVDDFKEKYISTSSQINAGWFVAALNIISEAASGYKLSRNKKLFVELVLIKLCYLQQAIEITVSSTDTIKKKIIDKQSSLSFRNLVPIKIKDNSTATNISQSPPAPSSATLKIKKTVQPDVVQEKEKIIPPTIKPVSTLKGIREKIQEQHIKNSRSPIPLQQDTLTTAWQQYVLTLEEKKQHSLVSSFNLAKLSIENNDTFIITLPNRLHQKFIESERELVLEYLQKVFYNRALTYRFIVLEEKAEKENIAVELSHKQQFQRLSEQFPNIKILKEKLKLELD